MGKYGGKVIYCCRDSEGPIEVVEAFGVRCVHFGTDARQSAMALAEPDRLELSYLRAMLIGLIVVRDPSKILILGLGGGSLARFLLHNFPEVRIDVVELRPAMVEVAQNYFGLYPNDRLHIHISEAGEFLSRSLTEGVAAPELILVDLFDEQGLAPVVLQHDFFAALAAFLGHGGIVCINLWSGHAQSLQTATKLLKLYFPGRTYSLPVIGRGNVIGIGLEQSTHWPTGKSAMPRIQQMEFRLGIEFRRLLGRISPRCLTR